MINQIRDSSGATVDIFGTDVQLSGTAEQVAKARALVQKIVDQERAGPWSRLEAGEICEDVTVPKAGAAPLPTHPPTPVLPGLTIAPCLSLPPRGQPAVGMVIGRAGMTIRQLKEDSGANISVENAREEDASGEDDSAVVKVRGGQHPHSHVLGRCRRRCLVPSAWLIGLTEELRCAPPRRAPGLGPCRGSSQGEGDGGGDH